MSHHHIIKGIDYKLLTLNAFGYPETDFNWWNHLLESFIG